MKANLTFVRKLNQDVHLIGIKNPINISVLSELNLISGQPVIAVIANDKIVAIYLISNNGDLFQTIGNKDLLFDMNIIDDLSLINIQKFNLLRYFLINSFECLSLNEIKTLKNEIIELENKIFYSLLHTEIELNNLKKYIIREFKKMDFKYDIKQKMIAKLTKLKMPNKKLLNKKIDIDLSGYRIYINTRIQ